MVEVEAAGMVEVVVMLAWAWAWALDGVAEANHRMLSCSRSSLEWQNKRVALYSHQRLRSIEVRILL